MADYTAVTVDYNSGAGTDASPIWTGTTISFGGSAGANEFRFQRTAAGGGVSTSSASWPNIIKPGATALVEECWAFSADTTGLKCVGYTGLLSSQFNRTFRINFDNLGSPASAMQISAFQDAADTTPVAGTQVANSTNGQNIINGSAGDSSSTSYWKMNAYGSGFPAAGAQETPPTSGQVGTTCVVTTGTAGSVSPAAASWLATWQSAQGWIQYITAPSIAKVLQAFFWYINGLMFIGPNMQTGIMVWSVFTLQYTWT